MKAQIKSLWPSVPSLTNISIKDTIKHQEKKYEVYKEILLQNYARYNFKLPYFESSSKFFASDHAEGFLIAQINNKKQYKKMAHFTCVDKNSIFKVEMNLQQQVEKNTLLNDLKVTVDDLIPGIVVGMCVKKKFTGFKHDGAQIKHLGALLGVGMQNYIASDFILPELKNQKDNKKPGPKIIFISDVHVGSKVFLEIAFLKLIQYINADKTIDALVITGDICDGTAVYPGQKDDLAILSYADQYTRLALYLERLRKDVNLILIPGNHDLPRREPQQFDADSKNIKKIFDAHPSSHVFSNPAYISYNDYNLLLYHGASFDSLIAQSETLSYETPTTTCKRLLRYRNLCPSTDKVPIAPTEHLYHVVPEKVDVLAVGHTHKLGYQWYKNMLIVSSATWQALTAFQDYVGLVPDYGKALIHTLGTKTVEQLDFATELNTLSYKAVT